ncbi:MAG: hypothetical protein R3C18_20555 [Planctomycetaceae bacterium]
MTFTRRILHHGPSPLGAAVILDDRAIRNCWFELHRQGGCGVGEVRLADEFPMRDDIQPGDWISFEGSVGVRWYLGRVEEIRAQSPSGTRIRLEGMGIQLNEVFPGGFGLNADGVRPHRFAATDLFGNDPDRQDETVDFADRVDQVVHLLMSRYVVPQSSIQYIPSRIESPLQQADVTSLKFRGEETVRTIIKDLAIRAQDASWGVDANGEFFFLRPRDSVVRTYRESLNLTSLTETRNRDLIYNRLLLTGDYVYDKQEDSNAIARRTYRWRGNFVQPQSRQQYGERRIRLWIPWIRTQADSYAFAREFFRTYARPASRFLVETTPLDALLTPWDGRVVLENSMGQVMATSRVETVRVSFDHQPRFRMELGPADPRELWAEPPQDERWESPEEIQNIGGSVSFLDSFQNSSNSDPPPPNSTLPPASTFSSEASSDNSSDVSSDVSSDISSDYSSAYSSAGSSLDSSQPPLSSSVNGTSGSSSVPGSSLSEVGSSSGGNSSGLSSGLSSGNSNGGSSALSSLGLSGLPSSDSSGVSSDAPSSGGSSDGTSISPSSGGNSSNSGSSNGNSGGTSNGGSSSGGGSNSNSNGASSSQESPTSNPSGSSQGGSSNGSGSNSGGGGTSGSGSPSSQPPASTENDGTSNVGSTSSFNSYSESTPTTTPLSSDFGSSFTSP